MLSEHKRRWVEIQLYLFCIELYNKRRKTIDIIDVIEILCRFGEVNFQTIKTIINSMLNDTYYQPHRREIILLGHLNKISDRELGSHLNLSRQAIHKYVQTELDTFTPVPRCNPNDDHEIAKLIDAIQYLKKAGF